MNGFNTITGVVVFCLAVKLTLSFRAGVCSHSERNHFLSTCSTFRANATNTRDEQGGRASQPSSALARPMKRRGFYDDTHPRVTALGDAATLD